MKYELKNIADLIPNPKNARTHSKAQIEKIAASIKEFQFMNPVIIDSAGNIIAGHGRVEAAKSLDMDQVPCLLADHLTAKQKKAYILADNRLALDAGWNEDLLRVELEELLADGFDLGLTGFDENELNNLFGKSKDFGEIGNTQSLSERFMFPPFSVLNAREGKWQERKRAWIALGIKSEIGRGENALGFSEVCNSGGYKKKAKSFGTEGNISNLNGTSIFDPVLCEILYLWFSKEKSVVLDPFAGGSVRGIVAAKMGREYTGGELRPEQVAANEAQAKQICGKKEVKPKWICGDSRNIAKNTKEISADFIFSCPPYADLEVYSDNPADLSTLKYPDFKAAYFEIIRESCALLKNDRFACFVVGEVRDKKGNYYNFIGDTIEAFRAAGLEYYNEEILVTSVGSLPIRAGKQFSASRKLGKTHQNILVFLKGNGKKASEYCGHIEYSPAIFDEINGDSNGNENAEN